MKKEIEINKVAGITLIALTITLIVLLILAGIIILQLSDNNVIKSVIAAKEKHTNSTEIQEATLKEYEKEINSASRYGQDGNPTGTIIAFYGNNAPEGYLKCDGTEYDIKDYNDLAQLVYSTTGSYGTNNSGKFAVPNLTDKFLKGNTTAGEEEEAGLPNITGTIADVMGQSGSGALSKDSGTWHCGGGTSANWASTIRLNASWSNPIYGKSNTVTPNNISVVYCIKY